MLLSCLTGVLLSCRTDPPDPPDHAAGCSDDGAAVHGRASAQVQQQRWELVLEQQRHSCASMTRVGVLVCSNARAWGGMRWGGVAGGVG